MKDAFKKGYEKVKGVCVKHKTAISLVLVAVLAGVTGYGIKTLRDGSDDDSVFENVDLGDITE